jgi:hypothetical protein
MGLYKRTKNNKKPLIRQIIDLVPRLPVADRSVLGLTKSPARSTMSDGNKNRDCRIFETLYQKLLQHYKRVLSKAYMEINKCSTINQNFQWLYRI